MNEETNECKEHNKDGESEDDYDISSFK